MAEGIEGNGYVDRAAVEASSLAPAGLALMPEVAPRESDAGGDHLAANILAPDILAIVQHAERAAVRRFAYPFVRLVADEA